MTAVVVREGQGRKAASLRSPRGPRALAAIAFVWTAAFALLQAPRASLDDGLGLVLATFFAAVCAVGLATRLARLSVDGDGVHWGIGGIGFRFARGRIRAARVYIDGVTLVPESGRFAWHLGARDWARFDAFPRALGQISVPLAAEDRKAPLSARMQSYGLVLDALLASSMAATTALYLLA
ncbi:MAG TPA: hypothetical protein VKE22_26860 [Haliangiales bacterium]|nr:hypothetical protein [Haliangiales bacterium]